LSSAGQKDWQSISTSQDGTKVVAVQNNPYDPTPDYIYYSPDSGVSWSPITNAGQKNWYSVSMSGMGGQ